MTPNVRGISCGLESWNEGGGSEHQYASVLPDYKGNVNQSAAVGS